MAPGARNKFATPCSNLRSFGIKCTVLNKSAHDIAAIFGPPQWLGARGIVPLAPSLRLWCYAKNIGKFSESKQIFKSERHENLQFSKTIRHGSCTDCQQRLLAKFQVPSCSFVSLPCLPHAFLRRGPVLVFLIKNFSDIQQATFLRLEKFENNFWIVLKAASSP